MFEGFLMTKGMQEVKYDLKRIQATTLCCFNNFLMTNGSSIKCLHTLWVRIWNVLLVYDCGSSKNLLHQYALCHALQHLFMILQVSLSICIYIFILPRCGKKAFLGEI